ncbi:MAG TPA: PKD domain-containing protein [Thermoanaerobaculaceae bacterium]|nr:PKD domain-containing protein [Thermoanaerobaculaceae bacterium]
MAVRTKVGSTGWASIALALALALVGLATASEGADRASILRALTARLQRGQALATGVVPLASGSGFARSFGGSNSDVGNLIRQSGSNFVLGGLSDSFGPGSGFKPWLTELDGSGNLISQHVWGTDQAEAGFAAGTPDGGYFVTVVSEPTPGQFFLQLIKLNSSFATVWQQQYGNGSEGMAAAAVQSDNTFLVYGNTPVLSGGGTLSFVLTVIKTDTSGHVVWQKQFTAPSPVAVEFNQLADGSFIGAGTIGDPLNPGTTDIIVVKLDSSGNITWQKSFGGPGQETAFLALPISGGYLIAASTTSFGAGKADVWLLQLDTSGNLVKQEVIGGAGDENAYLEAVSGGYILSGSTDSSGAGSTDGWLAFLDSNLNVTSSKTYGGSGADMLVALPDSAGGFLLLGTTTSFAGGSGGIWLVKTDGSGTPIWQNTYPGAADGSADINRLSGGGLLLSGSTEPLGSAGSDMLAMLLDANGQLAGCDLIHPTTVNPANFPVTVTPTHVTPGTLAVTESPASVPLPTTTLSAISTNAITTMVCGAASTLAATATASATSGTAPLPVNFTGSASGGTSPYTFDWDFGDGSAHSGQQNPAHTYASAGTYSVVLKVTDAAAATATDSHLVITVSSAGSTLTITTTSPLPSGTVGVAYSFQFTSTGGTGATTWSVVSGSLDSLTLSAAGALAGTPTASGDFSLTIKVVDSASGSAQGTFALHVSSAGSFAAWVPVASHANGLNSSQWRSDLGLLNPGGSTANVEVVFVGDSANLSKAVSVAAGTQSMMTDVVGQLGGSGSGALEVTSDRPLFVTTRTYNQVSSAATCYARGTQGQDYPAVASSGGLTAGQTAYLAGLTEDASYHTNIGIVDTGATNAVVLVKLYNGAGTNLAQYTVRPSAGEWIQATQPFKSQAGQTAMASGYATVTIQSGSGVFAFASVIDNITNDPTTVAMQVSAPSLVVWVPVASHTSGLNGSQWRSSLSLLNPGPGAANVQVVFVGSGGNLSKTVSVAAGTQSILTDVVGQLGGSGSGALEVTSSRALYVTAHTYNQVSSTATCYASGTQGQDYPAVASSGGLGTGQTAYLAGLTENASYHTNIGIVNAGSTNASVLVKLYNGAGTYLAEYTVPLAPGAWAQATQPFKTEAGQAAMASGYATVTVQSGTGVFAFASVIDNITNDPTTVATQQ